MSQFLFAGRLAKKFSEAQSQLKTNNDDGPFGVFPFGSFTVEATAPVRETTSHPVSAFKLWHGGVGFTTVPEANSSSSNTQVLREKARVKLRPIFMESEGAKKQSRYRVVLITEGLGNLDAANWYSGTAIEMAPPLFEGRKCFADHPTAMDEELRPERSVREVIGYYENVKAKKNPAGLMQLAGDLVVNRGAGYDWARDMIEDAIEYSKKHKESDLVGLSIVAFGDHDEMTIEQLMDRGVPKGALEKINQALSAGITHVNYVSEFEGAISCDLVTEAGAGGRIEQAI